MKEEGSDDPLHVWTIRDVVRPSGHEAAPHLRRDIDEEGHGDDCVCACVCVE